MHLPAEPCLAFEGTCQGHEGARYNLPVLLQQFLWPGWLCPASDKSSGLFSLVFGLLNTPIGKFETHHIIDYSLTFFGKFMLNLVLSCWVIKSHHEHS